MNKCLITKLNGSCDNKELLRIEEMRVHFAKVDSPTSVTQGKTFAFAKNAELEIIGDAYFTNANLSANLGKKITIPANSEVGFFVSNADCDISILDKYSLTKFNGWVEGVGSYSNNISFSLEDLKYSTTLESIDMLHASVTGDIANLNNLTSLHVISLKGASVTGDIANLQNLTSLTDITLPGATSITGDIANLKNLTSLKYVDLYGASITGDIAQLEACSNIGYLRLPNNVVGDLARLPAKCYFVSLMGDNTATYTWSSRSSSSNIFGIESNILVTNVDKMLQDLAQCQAAIPASGASWYKTISVLGNRTSASDDAVSALQQKGYTISIAKA